MKLKTYLRGLGIGIIVTAFIMGISTGGKSKAMSDEEIIARAKELGMVESTAVETETETASETESVPETETEEITKTETEEMQTEETQTEEMQTEETKTEETQTEEMQTETQTVPEQEETVETESKEATAGEVVSITIVSGDGSGTVSQKLYEAGLIISATEYDKYLCDNGYSKKLSPGIYEIAIGSSEETIAKIISRTN